MNTNGLNDNNILSPLLPEPSFFPFIWLQPQLFWTISINFIEHTYQTKSIQKATDAWIKPQRKVAALVGAMASDAVTSYMASHITKTTMHNSIHSAPMVPTAIWRLHRTSTLQFTTHELLSSSSPHNHLPIVVCLISKCLLLSQTFNKISVILESPDGLSSSRCWLLVARRGNQARGSLMSHGMQGKWGEKVNLLQTFNMEAVWHGVQGRGNVSWMSK